MNTARKFKREECARAEAEAYLQKLRYRVAYRTGTLERAKRANDERIEMMRIQAESYLGLLYDRSHAKPMVRAKMAKTWKWQNDFLRKQADAYRKWLRRYFTPEQFGEETTFETAPSKTVGTRHMTLVQSEWYSEPPLIAASG